MLVVGAGGLGSPAALYLAAAGVGTLGLVDFDVVDESNLHRQILFGTSDVGSSKLETAAARLAGRQPERAHPDVRGAADLGQRAPTSFADFDIVADGTDNFPTRYLVNDACVLLGKPNVYASIFRFEGQASVFWAAKRALLSLPLRRAAAAGSRAVLRRGRSPRGPPGTSRRDPGDRDGQARLWASASRSSAGSSWSTRCRMRFRELTVRKNPECAVCGARPSVTELIDYESFCGTSGAGRRFWYLPVTCTPTRRKFRSRSSRPCATGETRSSWWTCASRASGRSRTFRDRSRFLSARWRRVSTKLSKDDEIVVYCRTGGRSGNAVQFLMQNGYEKVRRTWPAASTSGPRGSTLRCRGTETGMSVAPRRPDPPRGSASPDSSGLRPARALRIARAAREAGRRRTDRAPRPLGDDPVALRRNGVIGLVFTVLPGKTPFVGTALGFAIGAASPTTGVPFFLDPLVELAEGVVDAVEGLLLLAVGLGRDVQVRPRGNRPVLAEDLDP